MQKYQVEINETLSRIIESENTISKESNAIEYVLNTNSKKFHYTWCSSVKNMKDKNRKNFTGTRDEVINKGYQPCKICNP